MIIGVDEAGRGCWAGPLVAAAVLLDNPIAGVGDSKGISSAKRVRIASLIKNTLPYGVGVVSASQVDELGLTRATSYAMKMAVDAIAEPYSKLIIDGNYNYLPEYSNVQTVIKADVLIPAAGAASILAKVTRDMLMIEQSTKFPKYGFERHVGYGTLQHSQALERYGLCELHRRSFKPIQRYAQGKL
jgi:ribonuclease HII